jgi:hypothetical protein
MKVTSEAETDIDQQDCNRKKLAQEIKNRLINDRDQDNIKYIRKPEFGIEFHRLKLKTDNLDHRIYFDYIDSELIVFTVRHRDYSYSNEDLQEVEKRLNNLDKD